MKRLLFPAALVLAAGVACNSRGGDADQGRQTARAENTVTGGAHDSIFQRSDRPGANPDQRAARNAANAGAMGTSRDTVASGTRAMQPSPAGGAASGASGASTAAAALGAIDAADRLEIQTAQLALQRSQSTAVKQLATTLLRDHRANLQQAEQLAKRPGMQAVPPTAATTQMTAAGDELKRATGQSFDLAYVQMQIDSHQKNIASLQQMQGQLGNDPVKAFVTQTLPTLQHHLQLAEAAKRRLDGSGTQDSTPSGAARDSSRP